MKLYRHTDLTVLVVIGVILIASFGAYLNGTRDVQREIEADLAAHKVDMEETRRVNKEELDRVKAMFGK